MASHPVQPEPPVTQTATAAKLPVSDGSLHLLTFLLPVVIFLGAALLFLIEPLFAKLILPRFGGSAGVWATCLVFYQSALLLGYLYADIISRRMNPARQSALHISLLLVSLLFLPIANQEMWRPQPGSDPSWKILGLLTTSIGLPFVLLSSTSPLVQHWHARVHRIASEPYYLFALSNLASLFALLSFPFLIEPRISSHRQATLWSLLFGVFVILCSVAAWLARNTPPLANLDTQFATEARARSTAAPPAREKILWFVLSACGSILLLSITNHLTENVAPIPLLWVLPLALYLLTFTMAFNRRALYSRWLMVRLLAVALGSLGYAIYEPSFTESIQVSVPFFCIGLFACCLFCHGELARRRPAPVHLTSFYLMLSLGGALGAIAVGLLAPRTLTGIYEFPLALVLTAALALVVLWPVGWLERTFWIAGTVAMIAVFVRYTHSYRKDTVLRVRNFYGALRVKQNSNWLKQPYRTLYNGKIEHGAQFLNPPMSLQATTYYGSHSGIGVALDRFSGAPKRVGVIGLGAGTLAAYGKTGDFFRFYDINPVLVNVAKTQFSYLRDTPARTDIVIGDARLSLDAEPPQQFDVLVVDAFSGDAIPVHLLTKEAFALYLHHLQPDGILAIHTSNTYLDLAPVVLLLANDANCAAALITDGDNNRNLIDASDWVLITRNTKFLNEIEDSVVMDTIAVSPRLQLWTDDHNNLFQILRPVSFGKK